MKKSTRYSPEVRERAVRMVLEHQAGYDSQWAAIVSVASKLGCTAETLRKWVRGAERDAGGSCYRAYPRLSAGLDLISEEEWRKFRTGTGIYWGTLSLYLIRLRLACGVIWRQLLKTDVI